MTTSVNLIDTLLIGQLGEIPVAAVSLSNQVFFVYDLVVFGLVSGASIFFSQFWGKRDMDGIDKSSSLTIVASFMISIPFLIFGMFFPDRILRLFTPDENVVKAGAIYLKAITPSFPVFAIGFCLSYVMKSTENVFHPTVSSVVSMSANVFLNYSLIFGKFGFPKLDILGAGLATTFARILEALYLLSILMVNKLPGSAFWKKFPDFSFVKHFLRYTFPTVLNELSWSTGMTMYSVIYARMETSVITARSVLSTVENFAFCLIFALSSASAVLIGKELGASRFESALHIARLSTRITTLLSMVIGFGIFTFSVYFVKLFKVGPEVRYLVRSTALVSALTSPIRALNNLGVVGILRAGGDTKFTFFLESATLWLVGIPSALISGLVLKFPLPIVYAFAMSDEFTKFFVLFSRYKSGKWMRNVVSS